MHSRRVRGLPVWTVELMLGDSWMFQGDRQPSFQRGVRHRGVRQWPSQGRGHVHAHLSVLRSLRHTQWAAAGLLPGVSWAPGSHGRSWLHDRSAWRILGRLSGGRNCSTSLFSHFHPNFITIFAPRHNSSRDYLKLSVVVVFSSPKRSSTDLTLTLACVVKCLVGNWWIGSCLNGLFSLASSTWNNLGRAKHVGQFIRSADWSARDFSL